MQYNAVWYNTKQYAMMQYCEHFHCYTAYDDTFVTEMKSLKYVREEWHFHSAGNLGIKILSKTFIKNMFLQSLKWIDL